MEDRLVNLERELDLNRDATPIYVQLATLFRRRIENGEWAVDRQIPTLDELALEFGVARATVRQATGLLKQEGLLARYRGRGTFVIHRPQKEFLYELETDLRSLVADYKDDGITTELLESRPCDGPPVISHRHGVPAPAYHYIRRRNLRGGVPYMIESAYLDTRAFADVPKRALGRFPTLQILHETLGIEIARVLQTLVIGSADVEISGLLRIPLNAPIAVVNRTAYGAESVVVYEAQCIYRGDFVRLHMRLK